jgi:hypothetical protein
VIQLPCYTTKEDCAESNDTGTCQQEPVKFVPDVGADLRWSATLRIDESINCFFYLCDLYTRVDDHANIVEAQANDLNCVFRAQRIVDQDQLI